MYGTNLFKKIKSKLIYLIPISLVFFVVFVFLLNSVSDSNILKIDLFSSDAYGDSNLQGRNQIWEVLLNKYVKADWSDQLFGMGLETDKKLTIGQIQDGSAHNAHNGYIFLLIATGAFGLFSFLLLLYTFFGKFFNISKRYSVMQVSSVERQFTHSVLYLFFVHTSIFLIASLTTSSILFQQQTWFFLFFAGYLYNRRFLNLVEKSVNKKPEKDRILTH